MTPRGEKLLAEFVDREMEFKYFCDMLDAAVKPIFVLWAGGGLGKTWLMSKLVAECGVRGRRAVVVDEHHHVTYLTLFHEIRDQLGEQHFSEFTKLEKSFADKTYNLNVNLAHTAPINVLAGATVKDSEVGDIAGIIVKVKELALMPSRSDMDVPEAERMIRLTRQFIEDFQVALAERPVVIFFDAAEKMPQETRIWLWETLFGSFLVDVPPLANARFVLATRDKPTYNRDMSFFVEERQLEPLDEHNVEAYLAKRGVPEVHRHELAIMLLATAQGQPNLVAMHTDSFIKLKQARGM